MIFPSPSIKECELGSNKKSFAIKLFQFCDLKTQQRYILQEEVNILKRDLISLAHSLRDLLKTFDHASNFIQVPLEKSKIEIGSTKSKDNLFAHYYNDIIEHPNRQIRLSCLSGNNNSCVFLIKILNHTAINLFLQKLSTLTIAKITISTRTDITLQTSVNELRAVTMCSAFTPDSRYDISTISLFGDLYCRNTKCSAKLCMHKNTFQSLGRNDYQCPQCGSVCQVGNIPFEKQINSFFLSLGQGVYTFEERPKSIRDVIGDVYCPGEFCLNR